MTQNQLAQRINVTNKAVSRWERGIGFPDISLLESLSKELDVSILELIKGKYIYDNSKVEVDNINLLLKSLMEGNKKYYYKNILLKFLIVSLVISMILVFYFNFRFQGYNNSYLLLLFNHISLIPFSNLYSFLKYGYFINFFINIVVNAIIGLMVYYGIKIYVGKKISIKLLFAVNVTIELIKWILLIGMFDINDILIRFFIGIFVHRIYKI